LFLAAGVVVVLFAIAAIEVSQAEDTVPFIDIVQGESKVAGALSAAGAGITSAGILAGLGGILIALVERDEGRPGP
jgi:hypothetical protein